MNNNIIRLFTGKIFADEFDTNELNSKWSLTPNDATRYSLSPIPGVISLLNGSENLMMLTDEPDRYVMDVRNEFIPNDLESQAGVIVFRAIDDSLEVLEYLDENKTSSSIYEYIRIIKDLDIYTVYGRNNYVPNWELLGSAEYKSAGKVGLIVKGPLSASSVPFKVDFVRIYKELSIQLLNLPLNRKVELYYINGELIGSATSNDVSKGVKITTDKIPPIRGYFRVYDENGLSSFDSPIFDMWGGDIFYYGVGLEVYVNGVELHPDSDYFLGYFKQSEINFDVIIYNPVGADFTGVTISAIPYNTDPSYNYVSFSLDGTTYTPSLLVGTVSNAQSIALKAKITRNVDDLPLDTEPYKFNIKITND